MAEVEMSRKELITKLLNLAFKVLEPSGYDLRTLATFLVTCEDEFGISEAEKTDIASRLTVKVMSSSTQIGNGRRKTD